MLDTTEETLHQAFSRFKPGSVERVKKLTDYAFVHYRSRSDALAALSLMNGAEIDGATVEVTLAKPAGVKEGSVGGKRYNGRSSLGNMSAAGEGGGGGVNGSYLLQRNGADGRSPLRGLSLSAHLGNPSSTEGEAALSFCVYSSFLLSLLMFVSLHEKVLHLLTRLKGSHTITKSDLPVRLMRG